MVPQTAAQITGMLCQQLFGEITRIVEVADRFWFRQALSAIKNEVLRFLLNCNFRNNDENLQKAAS